MAWQDDVVRFRRDLHQIPELAFEEVKTQAYLRGALARMGIEARPMAGTGLVADLEGRGGAGGRVALRADIDALPVEEETDLPFRSRHPGRMHACGHDAHMAMLLAAAGRLQASLDFPGSVRVFFQPSEEHPPGGALRMIAEGVLDGVDEVYGLHIWAEDPMGTLGLAAGPQMANADEFAIRIRGRGGHGSEPERTKDAVLLAAQTIVALQTIVSRRVPAREPVVVTVGMVRAGQSFNVIAERAELAGTTRTYSDAMRTRVEEEIRRIVQATADLAGAEATVDYIRGYPALVNHPEAVSAWSEAVREVVTVREVPPRLGAEDFAYYLQHVPGAFGFLGARPESGEVYPQHSPHLVINERALALGAEILVRAARATLARLART